MSDRYARFVLAWIMLGGCLLAERVASSATDSVAQLEQQAIYEAAESVAPLVVQIQPLGRVQRQGNVLLGPGPSSGLVVSPDGYILTSVYTLAGDPSSFLVALHDGTRLPARLVAQDHSRGLVMLKVDPPSPLGEPQRVDPAELRVGQWAIAVGKSFSHERPNVSVGIVSALERVWGKAVQTDAKISPNNYGGPLVDLRGRVIGILVPMSPHESSGLAGLEWYDSGIGFAVPLSELESRIGQLKQGEDLHAGLLGVSLEGSDLYGQPVVVAACHPKSPADLAGLKSGDRIEEINGAPISRQTDLKHVMGRLYAGDRIRLRYLRDGSSHEAELELVDELLPYAHPFLGILPERMMPAGQVQVRYVYADSPAATAGLRPGDRIIRINDKDVATADELRTELAQFGPNESIELSWERNGETNSSSVTLAGVPESIAEDVPAVQVPPPEEAPALKSGEDSLKLVEETAACPIFVPAGFNPDYRYGLAILLLPPDQKGQPVLDQWRDFCNQFQTILAIPPATQEDRWSHTDVDYLRKVIVEMTKRYPVDTNRIAVVGIEGGGTMAYVLALIHRDLVRGVTAVDAPLPQSIAVPTNMPVQPLSFVVVYDPAGSEAERVTQDITKFRDEKFPVTEIRRSKGSGSIGPAEQTQLGRWLDALDRI